MAPRWRNLPRKLWLTNASNQGHPKQIHQSFLFEGHVPVSLSTASTCVLEAQTRSECTCKLALHHCSKLRAAPEEGAKKRKLECYGGGGNKLHEAGVRPTTGVTVSEDPEVLCQ